MSDQDESRVEEVHTAREANRLYWTSESSVNQIAEELGLSKGALYEVVQPLEAGLACPGCGSEMAYPNRTARDKGFLTCPACGTEADEDALDELPAGDRGVPAPRGIGTSPAVSGEEVPSVRMLAGAALLGVAVGLFLGGVLRRR